MWEREMRERLAARTKVLPENNPIEKIYFTKGGAEKDLHGSVSDKRAALVISGKFYWLTQRFTHLWEVDNAVNCLGISISDDADWGFWVGSHAPLINKVILLNTPTEEIFAIDSKYNKSKQDHTDWTIPAIKQAIFDPIEEAQKKHQ